MDRLKLHSGHICQSCGDPATRAISDVWYCEECADEIEFGTIGKPPFRWPTGREHGPPRDDMSPGQEEAVRKLEDG